ncbi:MAG: hypothetical protein KME19_18295 [Microcoleus vaginatus WJT46-NPBG5]|jgi:hypothetical protein|nr:hypothetical protein [Microcoleus vaginatus WJT46-NPBG5]
MTLFLQSDGLVSPNFLPQTKLSTLRILSFSGACKKLLGSCLYSSRWRIFDSTVGTLFKELPQIHSLSIKSALGGQNCEECLYALRLDYFYYIQFVNW